MTNNGPARAHILAESPEPDARSEPIRAPLRTRFARLFLFAGLAAALATALPSVPRDQVLVLRLSDVEGIERVHATWTPVDDARAHASAHAHASVSAPAAETRAEPAGGVTLHFSGSAPRTVRHALSAANGTYVVEISVERSHASALHGSETNGSKTNATDPVAAEAPSTLGSKLGSEPLQSTYTRRVQFEGGETIIRL